MTTHTMNLKQPYFEYIRSGYKTIELRLYDEKRQLINPGDNIIFKNGDMSTIVTVKGLVRAENFESLFDIIDVKKTGLEDKEYAVNIMEQFYDKDMQTEFGVVGIIVESIEGVY